jgi:hypothetical protein
MPLINELLRRAQQAKRGMYGAGDVMKPVAEWPVAAAVRAWRAWAEALGAADAGDLGGASRWLGTAKLLLSEAEEADPVLQAEIDLLWARVFLRADEPRRAMPYAQAAWRAWFGYARNALLAMEGPSLPHLLQALIYPQRSELPAQQLFMEWLNDRASPNLHNAAYQVFAACRGVHDGAPALVLAAELRAWYRSMGETGGITPAQTAPLVALLLRDVADLHEGLGDPQAALDGFTEAHMMLQAPGVNGVEAELRQLEFNIANQQAKLGRHAEAIEAFGRCAEAFDAAGQTEPALRARHGALVSRWEQGDNAALLLAPLEDVLRGYEQLVEADESRADVASQNLHVGNRLWLSVASRQIGPAVPPERFLHQLYASREGDARAHTAWHLAASTGRAPQPFDQVSLLLARLAHEPADWLVLALESGVGEVLVVTLVGGAVELPERLVVERFSDAAVQALQKLLAARRAANLAIASHALAATAAPDADFEAACSALWRSLPPRTRERLSAAGTVMFVPEPYGSLDETPLELLHDGQGYLGLRHSIVRAAGWRQLAQSLAPNFVDAAGRGLFALVRGAVLPIVGVLTRADDETAQVKAHARQRFTEVLDLKDPTLPEFEAVLQQGPDVLHFTGHSYADDAGETLVLREDASAGVPELAVPRPHPAPLGIFCSCLVGLHRTTHRGLARGIASTLLEAGAPAVVAAMVPLPDQVGHDFALALHFHAASKPIGAAVQAARFTLSRRFHPATWGCFALFGRADAPLLAQIEAPPPRWPALLARCLATRGVGLPALRNAMALDAGLPPALAERVPAWLATVATSKPSLPVPPLHEAELDGLPADAAIALHAAHALAHGLASGNEEEARTSLRTVLELQHIADDNYLLVALVDIGIRSGVLAVQDEGASRLLALAQSRLGWLSRSAPELEAVRTDIDELESRWSKTITMQVHEMAGVSPDVYATADGGDRNAMKEMVWNLQSCQSSIEALSGTHTWMHWLYRMMAADDPSAVADFCGSVDADARANRLRPAQSEALRTLFKRYIGPGEIEAEHVEAALALFEGQAAETAAISLFRLHDRITSQANPVSLADIKAGIAEARAQHVPDEAAFLQLQIGGRALAEGDVSTARPMGEAALAAFLSLEHKDPAYISRTNLSATFLYNVAVASGDDQFVEQVLRHHRARIEAYIAAQQADNEEED